MVRQPRPEQLDAWLDRTEQSGIASLVSFAKGIRRDMVKRQMFGREPSSTC